MNMNYTQTKKNKKNRFTADLS